jgi:ribose 5-phosphate isomerase A
MDEPTETYKRLAAQRALREIRPGMLLGLGTGTTARYFIEGVGELARGGMKLRAVATSLDTARRAAALGIQLVEAIAGPIDLSVDGADEVDPQLNCIKGRGGALLRERVVAHASRRFVVIADGSKAVERLGVGPLPVEVLPFLWEHTVRQLEGLGGHAQLRAGPTQAFRTDNGNFILDVSFGPIADAAGLGEQLRAIPGVIDHGLFVGMAQAVVLAGAGGVRVLGEL